MSEVEFKRYISLEWNNIISSKELVDNSIRYNIINYANQRISFFEKESNKFNWNIICTEYDAAKIGDDDIRFEKIRYIFNQTALTKISISYYTNIKRILIQKFNL